LHLVPIGEIETGVLEEIEKSLEQAFDIRTRRERAIAVPDETYDAFREQYHSTSLLRQLSDSYPSKLGFITVLGIIDRDLFVPQLNFVFGEADARRQTAIVSLTRLRPEFYGLLPDSELLSSRAAKEAIHEIGHTYGLTHCPDPACVMYFSNRLGETDMKGPGLCRAHRDRLGETLSKLGE